MQELRLGEKAIVTIVKRKEKVSSMVIDDADLIQTAKKIRVDSILVIARRRK